MAAATDNDILTAGAYTEIAADAVNGVVQVMAGGPVRIHVGTSLPAVGIADYVLIGLEGDRPRAFSWNGFTTGDKVYARADEGSATVSTVTS